MRGSNDSSSQSPGSEVRGIQTETGFDDYRRGVAESSSDGSIFGDEPIGTDRAILAGDAPRRRGRIRPRTHGGTLRCLIEDVQSQRRALSRRIGRYQEEIVELQEEMFRQKQRERTLVDLLENWQRNVEQVTDQGD